MSIKFFDFLLFMCFWIFDTKARKRLIKKNDVKTKKKQKKKNKTKQKQKTKTNTIFQNKLSTQHKAHTQAKSQSIGSINAWTCCNAYA